MSTQATIAPLELVQVQDILLDIADRATRVYLQSKSPLDPGDMRKNMQLQWVKDLAVDSMADVELQTVVYHTLEVDLPNGYFLQAGRTFGETVHLIVKERALI